MPCTVKKLLRGSDYRSINGWLGSKCLHCVSVETSFDSVNGRRLASFDCLPIPSSPFWLLAFNH